MNYHDLITEYGNGSKAAAALGVSKQAISNWRRGIPEDQQIEIHRRTKGKLRADPQIITKCREVLRAA